MVSAGIPRLDRPPLVLDMATSAGTYRQIMVAQRDKQPLPAGIAVDLDGKPTTDPFKTVDETHHTHLLPFGGYKGFGLALMIELLCNAGLGTPISLLSLVLPHACVDASSGANRMFGNPRRYLVTSRNQAKSQLAIPLFPIMDFNTLIWICRDQLLATKFFVPAATHILVPYTGRLF